MQSHRLFLPTIHEIVKTNCGLVPHGKVKIVPATLGADTGLAGAAQVWINQKAASLPLPHYEPREA
jgi:hypothetical protein